MTLKIYLLILIKKNDVKSIIATIKNNNKQIEKWEKEGYNP